MTSQPGDSGLLRLRSAQAPAGMTSLPGDARLLRLRSAQAPAGMTTLRQAQGPFTITVS